MTPYDQLLRTIEITLAKGVPSFDCTDLKCTECIFNLNEGGCAAATKEDSKQTLADPEEILQNFITLSKKEE